MEVALREEVDDEEGMFTVCTEILLRGGGRGGGAIGGRGEDGKCGDVGTGLIVTSISFEVRLLESEDDIRLSEEDSGVWLAKLPVLPFLRGSGGGAGGREDSVSECVSSNGSYPSEGDEELTERSELVDGECERRSGGND